MLRRSFYLTIFLISTSVFPFSGIDKEDLPNFSSLAEYTSPAVVNVSVVKTIPSGRDRMNGSRSPFPPLQRSAQAPPTETANGAPSPA